jgi:hypothetical protein
MTTVQFLQVIGPFGRGISLTVRDACDSQVQLVRSKATVRMSRLTVVGNSSSNVVPGSE